MHTLKGVQEHGATPYHNAALAVTVVDVVAAEAYLCSYEVSNPDSFDYLLNVFDALAADVSLGVTTPKAQYLIPAGDGTLRGAAVRDLVTPIQFRTALSVAITKVDGTSAPTTSCIANLGVG